MGGKPGAYRGRREAVDYHEFAAEFEALAAGIDALLDDGDYDAFEQALVTLETITDAPPSRLGPRATRGNRLAEKAKQYARATFARLYLKQLQDQVEGRLSQAHADLLAIAAEGAEIPQYWHRLVMRVQAAGIRQPDVHPSSRALALHVAAAIREFNAQSGGQVDESYSDAPLESWSDLPPAFAGFQLIDVHPNDDRLVLKRFICPLPPSTDIAHFTADRTSPALGSNRRSTYDAWIPIIEDWGNRTGREMHHQLPPIWAMLLAHRMSDDGSNVAFFDGRLIESPWEKGALVEIKVIEDDVPDHFPSDPGYHHNE
jgi:hypothetical protein